MSRTGEPTDAGLSGLGVEYGGEYCPVIRLMISS